MNNILNSYLKIYPEISRNFFEGDDSLFDEIVNLFVETGYFYYSSGQIGPSIETVAKYKDHLFLRGSSLVTRVSVSGIGFYASQHDFLKSANRSVEDMFSLNQEPIKELWTNLITNAEWESSVDVLNLEYLRHEPPFTRTYWGTTPVVDGRISLARTHLLHNKTYYLYQVKVGKTNLAKIPNWFCEGEEYRNLSNACLLHYLDLPKSKYRIDGDLIELNISYLYPPHELNFLSLYSWPIAYRELPLNFVRRFKLDIFQSIKEIMMSFGYEFIEASERDAYLLT